MPHSLRYAVVFFPVGTILVVGLSLARSFGLVFFGGGSLLDVVMLYSKHDTHNP